MIRTGLGEGGVAAGEIRQQARVGKGQGKNRRAMVGGEWESNVDPGCVEERKQISSCPVEVRGTYKLVVIGD